MPDRTYEYKDFKDAKEPDERKYYARVRPRDEDEATPSFVSPARSFKTEANTAFNEKPSYISNDARPNWERKMNAGLGQHAEEGTSPVTQAIVTNPNSRLAVFASHAFPRMYKALDDVAAGRWAFNLSTRRGAAQGIPDLHRSGAAGQTIMPKGQQPGQVVVRKDLFERGMQGKGGMQEQSTLSHEMNHAVRSRQPAPQQGLPAHRVQNAARLEELLRRAGESHPMQKDIHQFARQYTQQGHAPSIAIKEGLTEAAARNATLKSLRRGEWDRARNAAREVQD